jgi:hypothetical protein
VHVLFDMQSPTFLRLFDTAIEELTRRGHRVTLGLWNADALERRSPEIEAAGDRLRVVRARPRRRDVWRPLATLLRETLDYVRYLDVRLEAGYLRERRDLLRGPLRLLRGLDGLSPRTVRLVLRAGLALEDAIPSAPATERLLAEHAPDVVVTTPLVARPDQTETVKSARALGVPSLLAVASWDHLTTKGVIHAQPDRVLAWNEIQAREASDLHLFPLQRVRVTGAHSFDRWFDQAPSTTREQFCAHAGLDPDRPFALFTGSSRMISTGPVEHAFLERWLGALRASPDPRLAELAVLVRPHPDNREFWAQHALPELPGVRLWRAPPHYAIIDSGARREFFDSLYHSAAVIGINTSAMIEAAIVGRPVLTVQPEDFADAQGATLHFRYLLPENGGFVLSAGTIDEHLAQLAEVLARPERGAAMRRRFLSSFVRPHGDDVPASSVMADVIEEAAREGTLPPRTAAGTVVLRSALWPAAALLGGPHRRLRRRSARACRREVRRGRRLARRTGRRARRLAKRVRR